MEDKKMNNLEKYINVFAKELNIEESNVEGVKYQVISTWDSVGHMNLIAALEETFDIMMDTDDIIDFDSFEKGKEILAKYDVEF
jgi:acyl carrier protein